MILHRMIAKQVEKYEKVENVNTQNQFETTSKKQADKKKADLFFVFCKCVYIPRKQVQDRSKEYLGNKNKINKKRIYWKSHRSQ